VARISRQRRRPARHAERMADVSLYEVGRPEAP
jgi:hypothetical protein